MCFSAPVSFTAGVFLCAAGAVLIKRLQNIKFLPLALIPLFFAVQQFAEGAVWLHFHPRLATDIFLFFAFMFWPMWIPFAFWVAERKKHSLILLLLGILIAIYLAVDVFTTQATFYTYSIRYGVPERKDYIPFFVYLGVIALPLFLSQIKRMWVLGVLTAGSGILIAFIDAQFLVSLWCFLAAFFSLGLLVLLSIF